MEAQVLWLQEQVDELHDSLRAANAGPENKLDKETVSDSEKMEQELVELSSGVAKS